MSTRTLAACTAALLLAPAALAHEGHGEPALGDSWLHYLLEPRHLPLTVAGLLVLALGGRWLLARRRAAVEPRRR